MMFIMPLLLVPLISSVERANFKVTCEGNFAIDPPEGGGVQIGDMLLNTNGTIESEQMKRMEAALATLTSGYANLTSEVAALKQEKAALITQVGDLEVAAAANASDAQATLATLTSGYANLTSEVATLRQDKAALMDKVDDLEAAAAATAANASSNVLTSDSQYIGRDLELHIYGGGDSNKNEIARAKLAGVREMADGTLKLHLYNNVDAEVANELLQHLEVVGDIRCMATSNSELRGFSAGKGDLIFKSLRQLRSFDSGNGLPKVTSVSFPALQRVTLSFKMDNQPALKSLSFPSLLHVETLDIHSNVKLNQVHLPVLQTAGIIELRTNELLEGGGIKINPNILVVETISIYSSGPITCSTTNGLTQAIAACKRFNPTSTCGLSTSGTHSSCK